MFLPNCLIFLCILQLNNDLVLQWSYGNIFKSYKQEDSVFCLSYYRKISYPRYFNQQMYIGHEF